MRSYVTDWGLDPVWDSAHPKSGPALSHFPLRVAYGANLTLDEVPPQYRVLAVAHDVHFDGGPGGRKLWYCDIDVDLGTTYFPFIRLALARYQPMSLPNCHLSRVIMTDFIQVVPDRTATVTRQGSTAVITVAGHSGRSIESMKYHPIFGPLSTAPNTRMRAHLERRPAGSQSDMAWAPATKPVDLDATANGFHVTWSGVVHLGSLAAGFEHRLSTREYEVYIRDWDTTIDGDRSPAGPGAGIDAREERIVYADVFAI